MLFPTFSNERSALSFVVAVVVALSTGHLEHCLPDSLVHTDTIFMQIGITIIE